MTTLALALAAGCGESAFGPGAGSGGPGPGHTVRFAFPLQGQLNADFFHTNYVDHEPGAGISDFRCELKTYDGHRGTDIVLPSFARMDAGVNVVAAAPGRVSTVQDGLADRNKAWAGGGFGNHVVLQHGDGVTSIYAHLMRSSITVAVGDSVTTGALLGQVGSSGMSDMPHLHIEFRRNGQPFDAYAGPCGPGATSWIAPLAYQDAFRVIAHDLSGGPLHFDAVKDPPLSLTTTPAGQRVNLWVHLHNVRPGMITRWQFHRPDGSSPAPLVFVHDQFFSMSWWWGFLSPQQTGTWRAELYHDEVLVADRSFTVTAATAAHAGAGGGAHAGDESVPAASEAPDMSGGALRVHRLRAGS